MERYNRRYMRAWGVQLCMGCPHSSNGSNGSNQSYTIPSWGLLYPHGGANGRDKRLPVGDIDTSIMLTIVDIKT